MYVTYPELSKTSLTTFRTRTFGQRHFKQIHSCSWEEKHLDTTSGTLGLGVVHHKIFICNSLLKKLDTRFPSYNHVFIELTGIHIKYIATQEREGSVEAYSHLELQKNQI